MPIYKVTSPTAPPPSVVNGNGCIKHQTAEDSPSPRGGQRVASASDAGGCGGETGSSLAELTEADRDTELLRRRELEEQRVQVRSQGGVVDQRQWTVNAKSNNSSSNHRYTNNAIEEELQEQNKRELELANSRQLVYGGNHHQVSPSSTTPTTTTVESSSTASPPPPPPPDSAGAGVPATRHPRPSESRIADEVMEQRRKETELRGRWKEMGLPVFEDDDDQSGNATNPEHPPSNPDPGNDPVPVPVRRWEERKAVKVMPYEDDEDGEGNEGEHRKPVYVPADETPIEREIRLAGEREDALRQSRGLEPLGGSSGGRETRNIEVEMASSNGTGGFFHPDDPSVKESMKKLASNRLQLEMLKEKERELTLKSQGFISTISEERAGDPVKYVEIIPKSPSSGTRSTTGPPAAAEEASKPPPQETTAPPQPAVGGRGAASRQPSAGVGSGSGVEQVNELETVFGGLQRQQPMMTLRQKPTTEKRTAAEKKILNELMEMQMREEELKTQRQSLLSNSSATESRDDEYSSD